MILVWISLEVNADLKRDMVQLLACPECLNDLELKVEREIKGDVKEGLLICKACNRKYPISKGVPNFIPDHPIQW
jgi:uncharacterized protein YbaR (Trm112 family)